MGELSLYYNIKLDDDKFVQSQEKLWHKKKTHGNHWLFARVQHEGGNSSIVNFIFEAYANSLSIGF